MSSVDERVTLVAYDSSWPSVYASELDRLGSALRDRSMAVEHIGSTAVPGLSAKPIIDLMVGVENVSEADELVARLAGLGYEDMGGEPGRRYLRRRNRTSANIQIVELGGAVWQANLAVRSYLCSHPREARRYAVAKVAAARAAPKLLAYSKEKEPFLAELRERALLWFEGSST